MRLAFTGAVVISGLGWLIAYADIVNRGFRDRIYGMPLLALVLNFSWELIVGFFVDAGNVLNTNLARATFVLDVLIAYTYFKFGRAQIPKSFRQHFIQWSLGAFILGFLINWLAIAALGPAPGTIITAWSIALIMSISFIVMLIRRDSVAGQSMYIAIFKSLASLGPALLLASTPYGGLSIGFGVAVFLFDAAYIALLYRKFFRLGLDPWTRRPIAATLA